MKKAVFIILQTLLLLAAYGAGAVLQALHKIPAWTMATHQGQKAFAWDGLVFLLVAFVLIVLVQAVRKVIRAFWLNPVIAFVVALLLLWVANFPLASFTPPGTAGM